MDPIKGEWYLTLLRLLFWFSLSASMQALKAIKDWLMLPEKVKEERMSKVEGLSPLLQHWPASFSRSPTFPVRPVLSLPAKSTRDSWLTHTLSLSWKVWGIPKMFKLWHSISAHITPTCSTSSPLGSRGACTKRILNTLWLLLDSVLRVVWATLRRFWPVSQKKHRITFSANDAIFHLDNQSLERRSNDAYLCRVSHRPLQCSWPPPQWCYWHTCFVLNPPSEPLRSVAWINTKWPNIMNQIHDTD